MPKNEYRVLFDNCLLMYYCVPTVSNVWCLSCSLPSVLWRCWMGVRKSIRPVKKQAWSSRDLSLGLETQFLRSWYWTRKSRVQVWQKINWWGAGMVICLWSEVQIIFIWSSWCHCHPIISCFIKSDLFEVPGFKLNLVHDASFNYRKNR